MAVVIRVFDCTLVGNHIDPSEDVLGCIPSTPKF